MVPYLLPERQLIPIDRHSRRGRFDVAVVGDNVPDDGQLDDSMARNRGGLLLARRFLSRGR